jgi:hypothetical protein
LPDAVTEALELGGVKGAQALEFVCGEQNSDIALVAADHNRLALRGIEQRGQPLLGIAGGNVLHGLMSFLGIIVN